MGEGLEYFDFLFHQASSGSGVKGRDYMIKKKEATGKEGQLHTAKEQYASVAFII